MTVRMERLDNGLRIVTHAMPHLETVSLGVWVKAGSRTEAPDEHGISHFLEHMAFKGTPTRSAREIAEAIESVGGDVNASTSLDTTGYYVRVLKEDIGLALEVLADIIQNPLFDDVEMAREKEVVIQEIAASEDSPDDLAFDFIHEAAYPEQALGRPILGTVDSVSGFTADKLRAYMKKHYRAQNIVVGVAGAINTDEVMNKVRELFSGFDSDEPEVMTPADYKGGIKLYDKPFEQSHIIMAFEGLTAVDKSFYAQQIFSSIFGGGMSSRLFQEAREQRGLCYSIYSFAWGMPDTGLFGIYAATTPDLLSQLSEVIINQLKLMAEKGPVEDELARAKAQLKAGTLMSLESTGARAEQLARQVSIFGGPIENSELIRRVESVTADDVRQVVNNIITRSVPACSGVGSFGDFRGYDWLKSRIRA